MQLPVLPASAELIGTVEPLNQVEYHLRAALAHVAIAEALAPIDDVSGNPSVDVLVQQIQKLARAVLPDAEQPAVQTRSVEVAEIIAPQDTERCLFEPDPTFHQNGSNGNGSGVHETAAPEANQSEVLSDAQEPQLTTGEHTPSPNDSAAREIELIDETTIRLPQPGVRPESMGTPLRIVTIKSDDTLIYNGKEIKLTQRQVQAIAEFISRPGESLSSLEAGKGMGNFFNHLKWAQDKLVDAGLVDGFVKRAEAGKNFWMFAADIGFVDKRAETQSLPAEPVPDVAEVKKPVIDSPASASRESEHTEQPQPEFDASFMSDGKIRRHEIITITNIEAINAWTDKADPYGHPPKLTLRDKGFSIGQNVHQLSDDQRELLNILLTNIGRPLTIDDIVGAGFRVFDEGPTHRIDELKRAAGRFLDFRLNPEKDKLLIGDIKQGTGLLLNPKLKYAYQPVAEDVKKKS